MQKLWVCFVVCALLAALLAGCTPAAQPSAEESGVATTTAATTTDAPAAPTTTEVMETTVITQSTTALTTDATGRTYPSRYTGRDIKSCVTAVTQETCLPFTVVAGDRSNYRIGRLPSIESTNGKAEAVIIRSVDEWEAIAAQNKPESAPIYDAAFFERGVLVLLVSHCGYWNYQLRITNAAVSGDTLTFEMGYIMPGAQAPLMTDWLVLIEMKKEDMEGVDTLRADYWKSRWAYPDEDA